ncbi:MAG: hypothetical protein K5799_04040 [Erythrobacter sp.]|nr:hypothetical protein [Erythrobacter sp.]
MNRAHDLPYEARRNPALPWGYWILIDAEGDSTAPLIDEYGERWSSLREALWISRLGMTASDRLEPRDKEQIEFLLAVLAMIDRTVVCAEGAVIDLFDGSWYQAAHYASWLAGHRLIEPASILTDARLTSEGRAILVMLASTRPADRKAMPIGLSGLHPFARLRPEPDGEAMEAAIRKAEAALPKDTVRFLRKVTPGRPTIVLVGTANAKMPMAETHWSISFRQAHHRDRLYAWLLAQPDRWQDWYGIARKQRAGALTEHLLTLFLAQDCEERGI